MDDSKIRGAVIDALRQIQEISGRECPALADDSKPISDLPGFDSQNGVELTCAIEASLDCRIPDDENLCVADLPNGRRRPRTLGEIVNRIKERSVQSSFFPLRQAL